MKFELSQDHKEIKEKLKFVEENDIGVLVRNEFVNVKEELLYCINEYNKRYKVCEEKIDIVKSIKEETHDFHLYENSVICGIYYVDLPDGNIDHGDYQSPMLSFINPKKEKRTLEVEEGFLYIFPSYYKFGEKYEMCKSLSITFQTRPRDRVVELQGKNLQQLIAKSQSMTGGVGLVEYFKEKPYELKKFLQLSKDIQK